MAALARSNPWRQSAAAVSRAGAPFHRAPVVARASASAGLAALRQGASVKGVLSARRARGGARGGRVSLRVIAYEQSSVPIDGFFYPNTKTVKFVTEDLQRCVLLDQYDNMDGTFDVYIAGVAKDSAASEAGLVPGMIVRALTNPVVKGEYWVLSENERLRFVKDAIKTSDFAYTEVVIDEEPKITIDMVNAATARKEAAMAKAEAANREYVEPSTRNPKELVDRPDLYSDKWDGDKYTGSGWNELTGLLAVGILVPVLGLIFALATRGTLWGVVSFY